MPSEFNKAEGAVVAACGGETGVSGGGRGIEVAVLRQNPVSEMGFAIRPGFLNGTEGSMVVGVGTEV